MRGGHSPIHIEIHQCPLRAQGNIVHDGRCQLVVEIVQVTDIRLEVVQNFSQLHPCFLAVNGLDGVGQLAQFAATVEIHI